LQFGGLKLITGKLINNRQSFKDILLQIKTIQRLIAKIRNNANLRKLPHNNLNLIIAEEVFGGIFPQR
jgi:hypothetical protein